MNMFIEVDFGSTFYHILFLRDMNLDIVDSFSRNTVGQKIYPNDIHFSFLVLKVLTYFQYISGLVT